MAKRKKKLKAVEAPPKPGSKLKGLTLYLGAEVKANNLILSIKGKEVAYVPMDVLAEVKTDIINYFCFAIGDNYEFDERYEG
jgi:hypothetical protein